MKRLTKKQWAEHGVVNPWLVVRAGSGWYITYTGHGDGRSVRVAKWSVMHTEKDTDPKGHWTDNGHKTFSVGGREDKPVALEAAKKWAAKFFKWKGGWERDPWGSWHPEGSMATAAKAVGHKSTER